MFGESEIAPSSVVIHNTDYTFKRSKMFCSYETSIKWLKEIKNQCIQAFTIKKKEKNPK